MDPEEAVERHRVAMRKASYRVTGNWDDADDATSGATVTALTERPQLGVDGWEPWLCKVARRKAIDILRKRTKEQQRMAAIPSATGVLADMSRDVELGVGTQKLLDRIRPFINKKQKETFELYCRVELGQTTEEDLARELSISQEALRSRLRRVGEAARNAAFAVCLTDDPGDEPNRCVVLFGLMAGEAASPMLLTKITRHIRACQRCPEIRKESKRLRRASLLVPGIGLTAGLLATLARAIVRKKSAAMAVTTTAAVVTVVVFVERPEARPIPHVTGLPPRTSVASASPRQAPPPQPPPAMAPIPSPPEVAPPPAPPAPVPPPPLPQPNVVPAATTVPAPAPGGGAREDSRPAISGESVEHRKITTTERGRCGDEPTTSGVDATVTAPGGLRSVTAYLWRDGQELAFPMTNIAGTSAWRGQLASEDTDGRFTVAVLAVGANGEWTVVKIGELCITTCS